MRHIKKFEDYDLGPRFSSEMFDSQEDPSTDDDYDRSQYDEEDTEECEPCGDSEDSMRSQQISGDEEEEYSEPERNWGDESLLTIENVKSFKSFLFEKKKQKSVSYKKSGLKHPEKADLDRDKKLSGWELKRGKAIQKAIESEKKEKGGKGLTAAQKKLPEGLRKAIEKKKNS